MVEQKARQEGGLPMIGGETELEPSGPGPNYSWSLITNVLFVTAVSS